MSKKKRKNEGRKKSLVEKIKTRRDKEDEGDYDSPYFSWPVFPGKKQTEKIIQEFIILGDDFGAGRYHWFKDNDGNWHKVRCRRDRFLKKSQKGRCLCCEDSTAKKKSGELTEKEFKRRNANTQYKFNAMWKGATPYVDEETGVKKCRLLEVPWSVWKAVREEFIDEGGDFSENTLRVIRISSKKSSRSKKAQISYKVRVGRNFKMPSKWDGLELWDFDELELFTDDEQVADWLGIDLEEKSLSKNKKRGKKRKKKRSEEDLEDEDYEEDDNDEDDEDLDDFDED